MVTMCPIKTKFLNILPVLHAFSGLVRQGRICLTPSPHLSKTIRKGLQTLNNNGSGPVQKSHIFSIVLMQIILISMLIEEYQIKFATL